MYGENEQLALQQKTSEEIRTELREQLPMQQTWDLQDGQTLEERRDEEAMTLITRQTEINETLSAQMNRELPVARAKSAAKGTPDQTTKPAKKSWKERHEESKRKKAQTKEMLRHTPVGDHVTYAFTQAKTDIVTRQGNSFPPEVRERLRAANDAAAHSEDRVDGRILEVFLNGHKRSEQGAPLDEKEAQKKAEDEAFLNDYISSAQLKASGGSEEEALNLRRPHLERITKELLNAKISEAMFTDEYMYEHASEMMLLAERSLCFENIMNEALNKPFFDNLPEYEKASLNAHLAALSKFEMLMASHVTVRGLKWNSREIQYITDVEYGIKPEQEIKDFLTQEFKTVLAADKEAQQKAVSAEVERLRKELRQGDVEPLQDSAGLRSLRELFLNAPEQYAAHKGTLDRLYQQYYRAVDTLKGLTSDGAAFGQIVEQHREATDIYRHVAETAYQKQMDAEAQAQMIRQQMENMADLMNFFLGGATLTDQARILAQQEGLSDQVAHLDGMRQSEAETTEVIRQDERTPQQRMEDKLKTLSFDRVPERTAGMTGRQRYIHGSLRRSGEEKKPYKIESEDQTKRQKMRDTLIETFSNQEVYGNAFMNRSVGNASGTVDITGLHLNRMTAMLDGTPGEGCTEKQMTEMYEKLLSGGLYRTSSKKEQAKYTPEQVQKMDDDFLEGFQELKKFQLAHLRRMRDRYGRYGSQLHPEDFAARMGMEFFSDIQLDQDCGQMMDTIENLRKTNPEMAKKYFDYENNPEDQEYRTLVNYFHSIQGVLDVYFTPLNNGYSPEDAEEFFQNLDQQKLTDNLELTNHWEAFRLEESAGGDGFTLEEEEAYLRQLREREKNGEIPKLEGRFRAPEEARIRTREEAIGTDGDVRNKEMREYLLGISSVLKRSNADLGNALADYCLGDRYTVGYTEERRRLMKLIQEIKNAEEVIEGLSAEKRSQVPNYIRNVQNVKRRLGEFMNGSLQVPENAQVLDFSHQQPTEQGSITRGSKRNGFIRSFSYWSNQKDTPLFSHDPTVNDLKQRMVSNCYMVAGTAGLVNIEAKLLKGCIKDNLDGTVTVRLYEWQDVETEAEEVDPELEELGIEAEAITKRELRPIYVRVSKEIPRMVGGADALSAGALWMQMIEKACAFVGRNRVKGYQSLWYGEGGEFLERLLGVSPKAEYSRRDGIGEEDKADLFDRICNCQRNKTVFNAGTGGGVGEADGLNAGHAYTVMGGKLVGNRQTGIKRYVLLRNPYSTMSLQHQEGEKRSRTGKHLDTKSDETYGQFYMDFDEFLDKFQMVTSVDLTKVQRNNGAL